MILILCLISGAGFAYIGRKAGFLPTWAMLFNGLVSIYLGIMLCPTLTNFIPEIRESDYYLASAIFLTSLFIYALIYFSVRLYLIHCFDVTLPDVLHKLVAVVVGFIFGYFLANFIFFLISITPLTDSIYVNRFYSTAARDRVDSTILTTCNAMNCISFQCDRDACLAVFQWIVSEDKEMKTEEAALPIKTPDPNE
ncbi:MAG: CvpA family protein [Sedimentisphaerales bacterium]|nr:CvpA family protein [Sedimentisphaerales bacterium]